MKLQSIFLLLICLNADQLSLCSQKDKVGGTAILGLSTAAAVCAQKLKLVAGVKDDAYILKKDLSIFREIKTFKTLSRVGSSTLILSASTLFGLSVISSVTFWFASATNLICRKK